jgi:hypothetical protein
MKSDFGMNRHRSRAIAILVAAFSLIAAAPNGAAAQVRADFNGDGIGDLAIGAPDESILRSNGVTRTRAGAVTVIYGTAASGVQITAGSPTPQFIHQDVSGVEDVVEQNDLFGAAIATGNFNGDLFDDLIVVVPGDNLIQMFHGSNTGLDLVNDRIVTAQGNFFENGGAPMALNFLPSLAGGNFNGDAFDDVAIAGIRFPPNAAQEAVVVVMSGGGTGVNSPGGKVFSFSNASPAGDNGGATGRLVLAAGDFEGDGDDDLAVGVPDADVQNENGATILDAGGVFIMRGIPGSFVSGGGITATGVTALTELSANSIPQMLDRFGFSLAAGDFDGDGADDLAVGAPDEAVTNGTAIVQDGGFLAVFSHAETLHGIYTQLPLGLTPQTGDRFAAALAAADFNGDGADDLAVGTPGDVVTNLDNAGSVTVLFGILNLGLPRPASNGLTQINGTARTFTQASTDIGNDPEAGDQFGLTLSARDVGRTTTHADLIIGVSEEDLLVSLGGDLNGIQTENRQNVGAVHVLYGATAGLTGTGSHFVSQNSQSVPDTAETGDRFGAALP